MHATRNCQGSSFIVNNLGAHTISSGSSGSKIAKPAPVFCSICVRSRRMLDRKGWIFAEASEGRDCAYKRL